MTLLKRLALNGGRWYRGFQASAPASAPPGPPKDKLDLSFNDSKEAFKSKYTYELVRAYFVYQLCSIKWLVENNDMIMKQCRRVFGQTIFEWMMRMTFYGQFVAGSDQHTIRPMVKRLHSFGVKSVLDYSVEEDLSKEQAETMEVKASVSRLHKDADDDPKVRGQLKKFRVIKKFADRRYKVTAARTYFYVNEATCEKNMIAFLRSIEAVHNVTESTGLLALKMTALGRPQLLLQLSEVIVRVRNYMQSISAAGGKGNVLTHHKTVEELQRYYGEHKDKPEVQEFLKHVTTDSKGIVHLFPWSHIVNEDMDLSMTFRVPDPKTGQMRRLISQITKEEEKMFRNTLRRLNTIIQAANEVDVRVMIDAEQTYFNPAISRICMELMKKYNKNKFLVFNTYQTYLKAAYSEMVADIEQAQRQQFKWAAKIVRGAYMEQERSRAAAMRYEDPICENFEATTTEFNRSLDEVIAREVSGPMKGRVGAMVASHNEDTMRYAIRLMKKHNIKPEAKIICFGQLLGMCDHVTFPLGQSGYSAYKYVPYGPVMEVLPYLSRRARENRGFLDKIKKEKNLLLKEIVRRIRTGSIFHRPVGKYVPV